MNRTAQRARRPKLVFLVALLLGVFSFVGYLQAGMLQPPGYRTAAWIYAVMFFISVAIGVTAIGVIVWRAFRRKSERPAI